MNQPLISVVMPLFNGEKYMDNAIASVLGQTYKNIELIIVNDASTDGSAKKCADWANKDERVRICTHEENQGIGGARNTGMQNAKGDYLTFVDSDDTIVPKLYETVLYGKGKNNWSTIKQVADAAMGSAQKEDATTLYDVYVWGINEVYLDKNEKITGENSLTCMDRSCMDKTAVRESVIMLEDKTMLGYTWNHMYSMKLFKEHELTFPGGAYHEDYMFNMKAIEHVDTMKICSIAGYNYSKHTEGDNLTNKFAREYFVLSRKRVKTMVEAYKRWGLYDRKVQDSCANRYLRYCISALARNCNKAMDMEHEEREEFIKRVRQDRLYREVVRGADIQGKANKTLYFMIEHMMFNGCLAMGRGVYAVKKYMPDVYSKKTRIK